ncbi:hypothetical protein ACFP1Z_21930 [Streptomyces gamaensis]|uniref:Sortase n=1 Tax=Streptomyces gamaensis TaxID=1763542 RepID=A0ABW0Z305_9ACTN
MNAVKVAPFRLALCAVLAAAAMGAAPVHAEAADGTAPPGTLEITPLTARPGEQVQLRVTGCAGERATAVSDAFVTDAKLAKDARGMYAETTVSSTVRPGSHPVRVRCADRGTVPEGRLRVAAGPADARTDSDARTDAGDRPAPGTGHRNGPAAGSPVAPVPAGGGGAARADGAPGTPGLILAGGSALIALGLIWHRRRGEAARR